MAQYVAEDEGREYTDEPQFRVVLIQSVDPEKNHEGSQYYFTLHCRLAQNFVIQKSIWYRTADEGDRKKDTWKIKALFKKAGVEPKETVEQDGVKASLYDEADLAGATLKALVYRNPESGYMDIFDFVADNADKTTEIALFNRFNKYYSTKFKDVQPQEVERVRKTETAERVNVAPQDGQEKPKKKVDF